MISEGDADALARLYCIDAEAFRRWMPSCPTAFYTADGQRGRIEYLLEKTRGRDGWAGVIVDERDDVIGQTTISNVLRAPFDRGFLGYWVSRANHRQGHASAAVSLILDLVPEVLGVTRLEAHTQLANVPSHHVLRKNGFTPFGVAKDHIFMDGEWRDDIFWQRILSTRPPETWPLPPSVVADTPAAAP